ncbi:MAG TPA: CoA pyrophosphatase [Flavobacterium sp.]|nr:CoA pyrophosphatase [Flavobacterium sp.]
MDFDKFQQLIPQILQQTLIGETAHAMMSPPERNAIIKTLDFNTMDFRKAAVMMLVFPKNDKAHLVLIQRNSYKGVHSSQIAFPGGKVEADDLSYEFTALRETHEEIGIPTEIIEVICPFSQVYIPPSNFMVYPFLGLSTATLEFNPSEREVFKIIELPLDILLADDTVVNQTMATSYSESIDVPSFKIEDHYVWGATAMMLSELKETLKMVL